MTPLHLQLANSIVGPARFGSVAIGLALTIA